MGKSPISSTPPARPEGTFIIKRFSYLLAARGLREAFHAVFFIVLARKSTLLFGDFMLAVGLGVLIRMLAEFGLNQYLVPRLSANHNHIENTLFQISLIKGIIVVCALAAGFGFMTWQSYSRQLTWIAMIISCSIGLEAFANTWFVVIQVRGLQKKESLIKSVASAVALGYGIGALLLGLHPIVVALFKILETVILLTATTGVMIRQRLIQWIRPTLRGVESIIPQVTIFGIIEVCVIALNKVNILYLKRVAGSEGVAQYSAAWEIIDGISLLVSSLLLQSVLYPVFSRLWRAEPFEARRVAGQTCSWLFAASMVIVYVLSVESDRLIPLIYGPNYAEAARLQPLLAYTLIFTSIQHLAAFLMMSMGRMRRLLSYYLFALLLNLTLCQILIPLYSLSGAAWSILVPKGFLAGLLLQDCQRRAPFIPAKRLRELLIAASFSGILYVIGRPYLIRELAEGVPLLPMIPLVWLWLRRQHGSLGPDG